MSLVSRRPEQYTQSIDGTSALHGVWVELSGGDAIVKPRMTIDAKRYEIVFLIGPERLCCAPGMHEWQWSF